LYHKPTGIQIQCSETRSSKITDKRHANVRLYEIELKKKQEQRADIEAGK
jgi:peptide chain release factor 2